MTTKNNNTWRYRLTRKYRIVLMNDDTLEEKSIFKFTRLDLYLIGFTIILILSLLIIAAIVFTPIKQYVLGYSEVHMQRKLIKQDLAVDSLQEMVANQQLLLLNIKRVIAGDIDTTVPLGFTAQKYDTINIDKRSKYDSLFRKKMASQERVNLKTQQSDNKKGSVVNYHFFLPIKGIVTNEFSHEVDHFGVDIVAPENTIVKATRDGTIILASWTLETGHIVAIQHDNDFISFYKHNSAILKKIGNFVKAGDVIAIIGNTGELTTGTHLHFEIWYKGIPVNPKDYVNLN